LRLDGRLLGRLRRATRARLLLRVTVADAAGNRSTLLRRLRDRARVRVVLRVRAVDAAGNQRTMLRRFTLTP